MTTRKVVTYYDPKPIADRRWDWEARLDDYEPHGPVGYGPTEREALIDLAYLMED
jgi:hypothetical protein